MKTDLGTVIDARSFDAIEMAIREHHLITIEEGAAKAGFMNLIVYGTFYDPSTPIVLIRGES